VPVAASEKSAGPWLKLTNVDPSHTLAIGGVKLESNQMSPSAGDPGAAVPNVLVGFDPNVSFKSAAARTSPGAKSFLIAI
jgi:hypothetical protein